MKFNLEKEVQKARFVIQKKGIPDVKAQVACALDVSGSTQGLFTSGKMQQAFQRILPIGLLFDDNKEVDVFTFCNGDNVAHIGTPATEANYQNYIKAEILGGRNIPLWGGTDYAPVIRKALEDFGFYSKSTEKTGLFGGMFGKPKESVSLGKNSSSGYPVVLYHFTDGQSYDEAASTALLKECQDKGVNFYVHFIGIGNPSYFRFIEKLGDKFDNVGFLSVADLDSMEEEDIYEKLIPEELVTWFKKSK
jgi:hypothetical protein